MKPTKSSVELVYRGNRQWSRFPNSDKQFIEIDPTYAVAYHSKDSEIVRVMSQQVVRDFSLLELLPQGGSLFAYTKKLHAALRSLGLTSVEFFTDDAVYARYLNRRIPTIGQESDFLQRMTKPTIVAYSKLSVGGQRQVEKISSLSDRCPRIEREAFGIKWDIFNDIA